MSLHDPLTASNKWTPDERQAVCAQLAGQIQRLIRCQPLQLGEIDHKARTIQLVVEKPASFLETSRDTIADALTLGD